MIPCYPGENQQTFSKRSRLLGHRSISKSVAQWILLSMARYIASLIVVGFLLFKHATYADPSIFCSLGDNSVWKAPVLSHIKAGVDTVSDKFQQFLAFMREYGKTYTSKEELEKRFHIFQENMKTVEELNAENKGRASFGITEFSDMTPEEFKRTRLGLRKTEHKDDTN